MLWTAPLQTGSWSVDDLPGRQQSSGSARRYTLYSAAGSNGTIEGRFGESAHGVPCLPVTSDDEAYPDSSSDGQPGHRIAVAFGGECGAGTVVRFT
jgi:hypothetical protein